MTTELNRRAQVILSQLQGNYAGYAKDSVKLLDQLCGEDAELRASVERLLAEGSAAGQDTNAPQSGQTTDAELPTIAEPASGPDTESLRRLAPTGAPTGTRFVPTEKLGEGGQGEVWLALDPELDRHVALKVVKSSLRGSQATLAQFQREAVVTGKLEHPNIVPVYEAGNDRIACDDALEATALADSAAVEPAPFYVMRVIGEQSLQQAVKEFHTGEWSESRLRELLGRFIDVCHAVGYAHSRGVIHRDLKPQNVMLGDFGETLLIDWGLAKVLGQDSTPGVDEEAGTVRMDRAPNQTQAGTILGTPAYMSPEQARGEVATLGPPTDVYGLGAILYAVLTGQPPVKKPNASAVLEDVRTGQIMPLGALNPRVPRALQAVCCTALSLQPCDRYGTAVELAEDVARWLNDEPVTVCRDPLTVRTRRWMRRHPALVSSTAATVLVAVAGLSVLSAVVTDKNKQLAESNRDLKVSNGRATAARELAETNAESARQQSQLALSTLNAVIVDVQSSLKHLAGGGLVREALLNNVLERLDQVSTQYVAQTAVDRNTMAALNELAGVITRLVLGADASDHALPLGDWRRESAKRDTQTSEAADSGLAAAEQLYRRAYKIAKKLAADDPTDEQALRDLSVSYQHLGEVSQQSGKVTEAHSFYRQMNEIGKKLAAADPTDAETQRDLSISFIKLGDVSLLTNQLSETLSYYRQSLKISEELSSANPTDAQAQRDLSVLCDRMGEVSLRSGRMTEALEFYRRMLKIVEKLASAEPADTRAQYDLSASYNRLGNLSLQAGQLTEALGFYRQMLEIAEKLAADDPTDTRAQRALSVSYEKLGDVSRQLGQLPEAFGFYRQSLEISEKLAATDPTDAWTQRDLSFSYERLADVTLQSGQVTEALGFYGQSLEIREKLATDDPTDGQTQRNLSASYNRLGDVKLLTSQLTEALSFYRQSLEISEKLAAADSTDAQAQRDLSISYNRLGDVRLRSSQLTEALGFYRQSLEISEKLATADPTDARAQRDLSVSYNRLGNVSLQLGQVNKALSIYRQMNGILAKLATADSTDAQAQRDLSISYIRLGDVSLQAGQVTEALGFYRQSLDIDETLAVADPTDARSQRDLSISYSRLGDVSLQLGQVTEALEFYRQYKKIAGTLVAADPTDAQAQTDLSISYERLAEVSLRSSQPTEALSFYRQSLEIRKKLVAGNPTDTQAQRGLSASYNGLGNVCLELGQVTEALGFYRQMLEIAEKMAAADPSDAQAQRDLSVSYEKLGDVSQQMEQLTEALGFYRQSLEIHRELAAADPTDAKAQRGPSVLYTRLGDVTLQLGQLTEALSYYRQTLEIVKKLAAVHPTDAQTQRDLMVSHYKLGRVQRERLDYTAAAAEYQAGILVLDRVIENGQNVEASRRERAILVRRVDEVAQAQIATGDLDTLLAQPAEVLPQLLTLRFVELAKRRQLADVALAAAKLEELAAAAKDGQAGLLYNAACGHGLCAKLAAGWDGRSPFPAENAPKLTDEQRTAQRVHIDAAMSALKTAIAAGWDDFKTMQQDRDLSALHPLAEFKMLLPAKP